MRVGSDRIFHRFDLRKMKKSKEPNVVLPPPWEIVRYAQTMTPPRPEISSTILNCEKKSYRFVVDRFFSPLADSEDIFEGKLVVDGKEGKF